MLQFPVFSTLSQIEDLTKIFLIDVSAIFLAVKGRVIKRSVGNDTLLAKLQDIERILGE